MVKKSKHCGALLHMYKTQISAEQSEVFILITAFSESKTREKHVKQTREPLLKQTRETQYTW